MISTIFWRDWKRSTANGHVNRLRLFFALLIVTEILIGWPWNPAVAAVRPGSVPMTFAGLQVTWIVQQYIVVFLLTAMFATATIHLDKLNGTLFALMLTPVNSRDIILGKWLTMMVRILDLAIIPLPIAIVIGGIYLDPTEAARRMLKPLIWLPMVTAMGLLAAVKLRGIRVPVLFTIAIPVMIVGAIESTDISPIYEFWRVWISGIISISITWLTLIGATLALRSKVLAHAMPPPPRHRRISRLRLPVRHDPIRWQESQLSQSGRILWIPRQFWWFLFGITWGWIMWTMLDDPRPGGPSNLDAIEMIGSSGMMIGTGMGLLVIVHGAGTIIADRARKTWELLCTTPLTAREIIHGKVLGIIEGVIPYLIAFCIPTLVITGYFAFAAVPMVLAVTAGMGATVAWLTAISVRQSLYHKTTARAIWATLGFAYLRLMVMAFIISPIIPTRQSYSMDISPDPFLRLMVPLMGGVILVVILFVDTHINLQAAVRSLAKQMQPIAEDIS